MSASGKLGIDIQARLNHLDKLFTKLEAAKTQLSEADERLSNLVPASLTKIKVGLPGEKGEDQPPGPIGDTGDDGSQGRPGNFEADFKPEWIYTLQTKNPPVLIDTLFSADKKTIDIKKYGSLPDKTSIIAIQFLTVIMADYQNAVDTTSNSITVTQTVRGITYKAYTYLAQQPAGYNPSTDGVSFTTDLQYLPYDEKNPKVTFECPTFAHAQNSYVVVYLIGFIVDPFTSTTTT